VPERGASGTLQGVEIAEYTEALRKEGRLLISAAERAGADAPVPGCPGWLVRDLLAHLGSVHRWATTYVTEGGQDPAGRPRAPELEDEALLEWVREGHNRLLAALSSAPSQLSCWTFLPAPSPLAFWARRQAHETAVHRVDAESAGGGPLSAPAPGFAADGIDELLCGLAGRRKSPVRTESPKTLRVRAVDVPGAVWTVRLSGEGPPVAERAEGGAADAADCAYEGPAGELYLVLWNRLPDEAVTLTGDRALARLWRERSGI
jgi:uncharacterized protein (TIGR03083 family)